MNPTWKLADRTQSMRSSAIRELLSLAAAPQTLSLAGGLPNAATFPTEALAQAASEVLLNAAGESALQYGSSEGLPVLRHWVAERLSSAGHAVKADQVLITTGSQQALDLLGKVLMQPGQSLGMEQPSYLGALQAFQPYGPTLEPLPFDAEGVLPHGMVGRLSYLNPNFQNPTGRCLPAHRRDAIAQALLQEGGAVIEDDPYGELWFEQPPPLSLASRCPGQVVYLGSFSKTLAPGLRLGYMVVPAAEHEGAAALKAKLMQAKQAADLHSPSLSQHIVARMLTSSFDWDAHLDQVRAMYRRQRDAMASALTRHMPEGWHWSVPEGGMFFWLTGPSQVDTAWWLNHALGQGSGQGVAFVPGASFFVGPHVDSACSMRLSFATLNEAQLEEAVRRLASCLKQANELASRASGWAAA